MSAPSYLSLVQIPPSQDCIKQPKKSQVCSLIVLPLGAAGPSDWTNLDSWEEVIDNNADNNLYARRIDGIGEIPESTPIYLQSGLKRRVRAYQKELIFDIDLTCDWQYQLLTRMQCGFLNFRFWLVTLSGRIIGGSQGIRPREAIADDVYGRESNNYELGKIRITWVQKKSHDRALVEGLGVPVNPPTPPTTPTETIVTDDTNTGLTDDTGTTIF